MKLTVDHWSGAWVSGTWIDSIIIVLANLTDGHVGRGSARRKEPAPEGWVYRK